jgi:hypothetical protein
LKDGLKVIPKLATLMYVALAAKFFGDRLIFYLAILGFFSYTPIQKAR